MAKRLYVGNLSYQTNDDTLRAGFEAHGTVESARVITSPDGRSRGFGFVEMANDAEAQAAIDAMNGQPYEGRELVVNEARPMEQRD